VIYLESVLAGITVALVATVVWLLAVFGLPLFVPFLVSRVTGSGGGSAASFSSGPLIGIALAAFLAGFYWKLHRGRK
jgi:ABC-type transport system involved in cytochrome c biogenesis permease component